MSNSKRLNWWLAGLLLLVGATSLPAVERILKVAVTNYTGYVIEADALTTLPGYNRDRIRAELVVESDNSAAGVARNYTNVLSVRLIDSDGTPQPLLLPNGSTNNFLQVSNVLSAPAGSMIQTTNGVALRLAAPLGAYAPYRVQLILTSPFAPPGTFSNDLARLYKHFTNVINNDAALNVLSEAGDAVWARPTAVSTDTNRNGFLVDVPITLYRFDGFSNAAPITNLIGVRLSYELRALNSNIVIPLLASQAVTSVAVPGFQGSAPRFPAVVTATNRINLVPAPGVQLDCVNEQYRLLVLVSHTNVPGAGVLQGNVGRTTADHLFHFNGRLRFGSIETLFTQLGSDPQLIPVVGTPSSYPAILRVINQSGTIAGVTNRTYGNNERIGVYLQADGTSDFTSNNIAFPSPANVTSVPVAAPPIDLANLLGVNFIRSGTVLNAQGGNADVLVQLPSGFGYTENLSGSRRFLGSIIFSNATLGSALEPTGPLTKPGPLFAACDSHPIAYAAAGLVWTPQLGAFSLTVAVAGHVAGGEFRSPNGERPANYGHYRFLSSGPTLLATVTASNGVARLYTDLNYANSGGVYTAHFPYGTQVKWTNGGQLRIRDGVLVQTNGGSYLAGASRVSVSYARDCAGCGTTDNTTNVALAPTNSQLLLTRDGGLIASGLVATNPALAWGFIVASNDFANRTEAFPTASFHLPGHSLRGGEVLLNGDVGGAVLTLTGVDADNLNYLERPDFLNTSNIVAYQNGLADYAGINFAVLINGARHATSILAGVKVNNWPLAGRSKYYVRPSGVTGIHEASPGGFPSDARLYGYQTTLSNYTLSFLDGVNLESRVLGSVVLPYPSNLTQDFSNLKFSCPGGLLSADLPGGGSLMKLLSYWQADVTPKTFTFASPDECNPGQGYLVMGVEAWASQFTAALRGNLGFKTDGNLITKSFADSVSLEAVDSRLKLANNVTFAGPGAETYHFTPVVDCYLNNYGTRPNSGVGSSVGWLNMAGTVDVPFFEDLKIHLHTGAQQSNTISPIYLMGGWPRDTGRPNYGWRDNAGLDFFTATYFDANNRGYPNSISFLNNYRASSTETNRPRAQRKWLDLIELDYPLAWSSSSRSFSSFGSKDLDFLILRTYNQIPYMSADKLELTFGLQYDGLPQINLANLALDLLDEQSDIARSLVDATTEAARDAVMAGLKDLDDILADLPGTFLDPLLDQLIDPTIAQLQRALGSAWSNAPSGTFAASVNQLCNEYIRGTSGSISSNVFVQLRNLSQLNTNMAGAVRDLNARLLRIESMVETNRQFIAENPPGSGRRSVGSNIVYAVVGNTAPQHLATLQGAVLDRMLQEADATFDALDASLANLGRTARDIRTGMILPAGLGRELNDTLSAGQNQIGFALSNACIRINEWVTDIESDYPYYTPAEIEERIRREIEDAFYGEQISADVQTVLRAWFHELNSAIEEAVDSAFAQFNRVMRDLISQTLAEVDDAINPLIGEVNAVLGAGRITGYAHFNADSLDEARLDMRWRWNIPEEAKFDGYAIIRELNSQGDNTCASSAGNITEVTIGATDVGMEWMAPDLRVNVAGRFSFDNAGKLIGLGGSFETVGSFTLEENLRITDLASTAYFGKTENYLGASAGMEFNGYAASGALFYGHACTLDPLTTVDRDIGTLLKDGSFTGAYGFARVSVPVTEVALGVPCSCLFCITASMGAGAGFRLEGHEFIGKIEAGVSGEALCLVNVHGNVTLAGSVGQGGVRFKGTGEVGGCIGHDPLEICHDFRVTLSLENGKWKVDHQEK